VKDHLPAGSLAQIAIQQMCGARLRLPRQPLGNQAAFLSAALQMTLDIRQYRKILQDIGLDRRLSPDIS
jgi:hypothetical protein